MLLLNRISHPDWVKLCVDPNGRIKLRVKQKYEIHSATHVWQGWKYATLTSIHDNSEKVLNSFCIVSMHKKECLISPTYNFKSSLKRLIILKIPWDCSSGCFGEKREC